MIRLQRSMASRLVSDLDLGVLVLCLEVVHDRGLAVQNRIALHCVCMRAKLDMSERMSVNLYLLMVEALSISMLFKMCGQSESSPCKRNMYICS
jgi:hypothetical protein